MGQGTSETRKHDPWIPHINLRLITAQPVAIAILERFAASFAPGEMMG